MTPSVELVHPDATVQEAAAKMAEADLGILAVGDRERVVGLLTDRDIVVRSAARGWDPGQTKVRQIMTEEIRYCFDDEPLDEVAASMGELQVRRLPVVDEEKRLVGIISLADVALRHDTAKAGATLEAVCMPGGIHSGRMTPGEDGR